MSRALPRRIAKFFPLQIFERSITDFAAVHSMYQEVIPMLIETDYNRRVAVRYALNWAFARNPRFYDFEDIGGDCTNFISQCLYAGCDVMNFSPENGWYYINSNDRAPAWTGVNFLRKFLLTNRGAGVYGEEAPLSELRRGDVIQLVNRRGEFYHTVFVSAVIGVAVPRNIFVCAHSVDARNRRLSTYNYADAVGIKILGARKEYGTELDD